MELISVTEEHYEFIRYLRTHSENREGFRLQDNITPEQQVDYMKKYSKNYFVCLLYGEPVGYVGVIDDDIRVCTHPEHKGVGVGEFMLKEIMFLFPWATGKIKKDNIASQKLFEKCRVPYTIL